MAQDNLDALTDAVMQAESRGRRFGSDAKKLLESVKGAQGEMQVMPKTQAKPGFGVEPAKDKSGDEIARVGRDYLKAMVGRYGDQVHALAAYNWGPGNTDKWLADGADMSKLPAETRKYIREVQSNLQSRLTQQGPGKTKEPVEVEPMMDAVQRSGVSAQAPAVAPASAQTTLAQLGPNYQAALALNTIAEQDEKDSEDEGDKLDEWQRDKEMEAEIEGGTAKRALAALEGLSFQSPVAGEQQPVRMAAGGAIQLTPIAALNPAKKAELGAAKADWDKYNANATAYNDALTKYKTEKYEPYVNAVNKYNTTLQIYGSLPATSSLLPPIPTVPEEFTMVAPEQPKVEAAKVQAMAKSAAQDRNSRQTALDAAGNPEAYGLTINRIGFAEGGEADKDSKKFPEMESKSDVDFIRSAQKMQMGDKELQNALLGLGMDGALVGATLSNMKQGDKDQLARSLMAAYNTKVGDVGVNASVMRPMNSFEEPEMYMGNIGASVPVGQGRLMLNAMGMQTPQESRSTGHSIGYERQIGPGTFSASMMQPRDNPDGRSYQLQYRMPVGRAEGSPMGGEDADHMTPQEIERMAAAQQPAFGTFPQMRPRRTVQDPEAAKNVPVDVARGVVAGTAGLIPDIVNFVGLRSPMPTEMFGDTNYEPKPQMPYGSEYYLKNLPLKNEAPVSKAAGQLGAMFPVVPVNTIRKGVEAVKQLPSKAAEMMSRLKGPKRDPEYVQYLMGGEHSRPINPTDETTAQVHNFMREQQGPWFGVNDNLAPPSIAAPAAPGQGIPAVAPVAPPITQIEAPTAAIQAQVAAQSRAPIPTAERPFIGKLDQFVADMTAPVQKQQFVNQVKNKFRDYDLARVEEALADLPANAKLTPEQLQEALSQVYSPSRWRVEDLPVKPGSYYENIDNVFPGKSFGVTNLYLDLPPGAAEKGSEVLDFIKTMNRVYTSQGPAEDVMKLANFLDTNPLAKDIPGAKELRVKIAKLGDDEKGPYVAVKNERQEIQNIENALLSPVFYKENNNDTIFSGIAYDLNKQYRASGMGIEEAQGKAYVDATNQLIQKGLKKLRERGLPEPDINLLNWDNANKLEAYIYARQQPAFKQSVAEALAPAYETVYEAERRIKNLLHKEVGAVLKEAKKMIPYKGQHQTVAAQENPIGFARYTEHVADVSGIDGKTKQLKGRHYHELQSDLAQDIRKEGAKGSSLEKDKTEYDAVSEKVGQLRAMDLGSVKDVDKHKLEISKLDNRKEVLGDRIRNPAATYNLEQPFANMEISPSVEQQLLIKNVIQAAMRKGEQFVSFPGLESAQAQLYEKLPNNLRQVVKDLGGQIKGRGKDATKDLEIISVPLKKQDGSVIETLGVTWDPDAAARILENGIPFAKGGMVERNTSDNRRYL